MLNRFMALFLLLCTPSMQALWRKLQQARSDFAVMYLAYHHFRGKVMKPVGWQEWVGLMWLGTPWISAQNDALGDAQQRGCGMDEQ
jgi:hypothetical protein